MVLFRKALLECNHLRITFIFICIFSSVFFTCPLGYFFVIPTLGLLEELYYFVGCKSRGQKAHSKHVGFFCLTFPLWEFCGDYCMLFFIDFAFSSTSGHISNKYVLYVNLTIRYNEYIYFVSHLESNLEMKQYIFVMQGSTIHVVAQVRTLRSAQPEWLRHQFWRYCMHTRPS